MRTTKVLLVRHGHTSGNGPGLATPMSGWADVPLTELGRREALGLRRCLAAGPCPVVYSSPPAPRLEDGAPGHRGVAAAPALRDERRRAR